MPRWLARLVWRVRGKRQVRLHVYGPNRAMTVEGILIGRLGGHYVLLLPKIREGEGRSVALEGHLEVPAEHVLLVQVMGPA